MLKSILDFCNLIADSIRTIIDVIISFFTDLVDFVAQLFKSLEYIPDLFSFLPSIVLSTVIASFTILIVLRIVGRD